MKTQHEVLMEDPEFRKLLSIETLVAEASESIARLMAEQNISKADLARRLGKSRSWVTQLLSGGSNMTIRTLAEVTFALDAEVKLHTQTPGWKAPKQSGTGWHASFKVEGLSTDMPIIPERFFRLQIPQLASSDEEPADVSLPDNGSSEYAA